MDRSDGGILKLFSCGILIAAIGLSGCGGGGSGGGGNDPEPGDPGGDTGGSNVGYFIDSAVSNISYTANGIAGETNDEGRFRFNIGEPVSFSYAGIELGSVNLSQSNTTVTPPDLRGDSREVEEFSRSTRNMLRLLQTLDKDGDPTNGIDLPSAQELEDGGLADFLSGQQLGDPSFDTQVASALSDFRGVYDTPAELVDEEDALAHFELTLEGLALRDRLEDSAGSEVQGDFLVGEFDIYTQGFGQYAGRITFDDSFSGSYEEWRNCDDEGERNWIGTRERAQALCNDLEGGDITLEISGATFTFSTTEITDSCTILSGDINKFTASCDIDQGNGQTEVELQYFVRTGVDRFTDQLVVGEFTEFGDGGHTTEDNSILRFEEDGTGNYEIRTDPRETGTYSWSLVNNGIDLQLDLDGETGPFPPIEFLGFYAGSFHTFDGESETERFMIPNYNSSLKLSGGEERSVLRYSLTDGRPLWDGEFPGSTIRSDTGPGNTGEVFVDDRDTGLSQVCRIFHSISPTQGGRILWADCTAAEGSSERSFELLWLP